MSRSALLTVPLSVEQLVASATNIIGYRGTKSTTIAASVAHFTNSGEVKDFGKAMDFQEGDYCALVMDVSRTDDPDFRVVAVAEIAEKISSTEAELVPGGSYIEAEPFLTKYLAEKKLPQGGGFYLVQGRSS